MQAIKSSRLQALWTSVGMMLHAGCCKALKRSGGVINTIAAFCEANEAFERSLSFDERLQRTGRIRYR